MKTIAIIMLKDGRKRYDSIPIHVKSMQHWCLVIVNIDIHEIVLYDSLNSISYPAIILQVFLINYNHLYYRIFCNTYKMKLMLRKGTNLEQIGKYIQNHVLLNKEIVGHL